MSKIVLSKEAAAKAITYSHEAYEDLARNAALMDSQVNIKFLGLKDPAFINYLELSVQTQEMLGQIRNKMDAVAKYCESIISWIDIYGNR